VPVCNYRSIAILNNFSKELERIIREDVSHYFKYKMNPCQLDFSKSETIVTILVTYLDNVIPLACSQLQVDAVNFYPCSTFDLFPPALILHKLTDCVLPTGYVNWFHSYSS
jgi:hypothetical protein